MTITGKKIVNVRRMTPEELELEFWPIDAIVICIELEDGKIIYPSNNLEGDSPGALLVSQNKSIYSIKID